MFRPCIDLHDGRVKQVVGSTFTAGGAGDGASTDDELVTNFVSDHDAAWYAARYRDDGVTGGHVIRLGAGNDDQAAGALAAFPGGLQLGGGVSAADAVEWIEAGASHVIVTSWLFSDGTLDQARLDALAALVGPSRVVVDLSCRRIEDRYVVFIDRWTRRTDVTLSADTFAALADRCDEFLIHAVDVEGRRTGVDIELVRLLAAWSPRPVTYAGGARRLDDLAAVTDAGEGRVHLTIGSALDLFGGTGVRYADAVAFNRRLGQQQPPTTSAR